MKSAHLHISWGRGGTHPENVYHSEKSGAKTVPQRSHFEKQLLFGKEGPLFYEMAPRHKEEPKSCHKGVCSVDKKMDPLRSRFGSSFFSEWPLLGWHRETLTLTGTALKTISFLALSLYGITVYFEMERTWMWMHWLEHNWSRNLCPSQCDRNLDCSSVIHHRIQANSPYRSQSCPVYDLVYRIRGWPCMIREVVQGEGGTV